MKKIMLVPALLALTAAAPIAYSQSEGLVPTQALIHEDSKVAVPLNLENVKVKVENHAVTLTALSQVMPSGAQVALLLDDGLRSSFARNIDDLRKFMTGLPAGTEVLVGYMSNGRVIEVTPFTTDHARAADALRLTLSAPGLSASPYFCLSEFVKHWPGAANESTSQANPEAIHPIQANGGGGHKARFVMMLTNGVDPYNGSVSPLNQDSPYVATAVRDAQRAGVAVYSIYYGDAGIRGGAANFSGQSYLAQISDATGGTAYYEGSGNPVSLIPYLTQFAHSVAETYVATFPATGKDLVRVKVTTDLPKVKLRHADEVRPGTQVTN